MKIGSVLLILIALAACGGDKVEKLPQPKPQEVIQEQQKTFRRQVFVFIDNFNQRMRNANIDAAIAGTGVSDVVIAGTPGMSAMVNPSLKIEWMPNADQTDIKGLIITQNSKVFLDENGMDHLLITSGLLTSGIDMNKSDVVQFWTTLQEYLRRLVEMQKLYEQGDPPQQVNFEFKGYDYILGFGGEYVFYSREKLSR